MKPPETPLDATGLRFGIVAARFNQDVTERLVEGALECFATSGAPDVDVVWVPGSFELPLAARAMAETRDLDGVVALGCIIRGDTPHFEFISAETASGLMSAMLETGIPMAFGVLTTEDRAQADARAGGDQGNKGWDAAATAIEMAGLMRGLEKPDEGAATL
ncbi:MAG: 6,7-dimethyl-8-ribityllumazine synthase [Actinomycetota bacterium]